MKDDPDAKDDLDAALREALRPVNPGEDFTGRVMARVAAPQPRGLRARWPVPAALAAAVLLGTGVYVQHQRQNRAGLEARRQVIEALRLTDEKLDLAYQTVKEAAGT
jgi:hypothetical protein